ncbi:MULTISPECIES: Holliday junction branch migration DNA helicase RuvB [Halobacteriovorax]|uniref:Holliday junction branch migration complex subunit RuvB n=1 Tax=Halobacteriovorax vibrionivorans TaxID=2152716 RepID=A0ABY0IKD6_9BACT|nr:MULTISPECIES: Holliday junction branch migration DNA helicase RuvB [Halobacteriovorax]AYF45919.1 Holliday junction DNA helicase RuvB [Halobacteriovorax sp. BALOs_7]RZF22955.1 Holliday junction branch migration DNA helicase RuvB [Halobacteriovorax vibrionivorans]TGD46902.1 Holliday junction branch migration DNA helicase RuvB [Halobacteriovorax sp. Y22]
MSDERIFDPELGEEETKKEVLLRPKDFTEYIGQKKIVQNIDVMVNSAVKRNQSMDHALLSGPPGLGKTSLAMIIANALGSHLHVISGPAIEKKGDLAAILTNLEARDVLFIDEIHRMHISVEEILYSAMEDYRLDIVIGDGAAARTMQIDIAPFTLIGATTRSGLLSNPLRDRFMAHFHFDFYQPEELAKIISNNAKKLSLGIDEDAELLMARCSRGTPRIANRILRRVRDFAIVRDSSHVNINDVKKSLEMMEIDERGLDRMDRRILKVIQEYYGGGPVGIEALCATLAEDRSTIEDVYEPFLLKEGFLIRTPRGREISQIAKELINEK